jgi:hypothetical protein
MVINILPQKINPMTPVNNLFLAVPDTDFSDYLIEIDHLIDFAPEILIAIQKDLDEDSKQKKKLRLADKRFYEELTLDLPDLELDRNDLKDENITIEIGCPRMSAYLVYTFLMIRGHIGSVTSKECVRFLRESMSLHVFLQNQNYKLPAPTTILENINCISNATRNLIFDCQLRKTREEGLDDFRKIFIDSTSVKANSAWPTDAKMINGLLGRIHHLGQNLDRFGFFNFQVSRMEAWLAKMDSLEFTINLVSGKANSKGKVKKYYRQLLNDGLKALAHLAEELAVFEKRYVPYNYLAPSRLICLERVLEQMKQDLSDAYKVITYTNDRVLKGKQLKSTEKVLSLSDKAAAFIKKGSRNPVIGYKPQVTRSGKGFVTSLIVPEGNAADSTELVPATLDSTSRVGIIPGMVSVDDGYASKIGVAELYAMGIKIISISGAKGKKLTSEENWSSPVYQKARNDRSSVESLMFTLKYCFGFGCVRRTGIEAVRGELLEKVIAYNVCRAISIKFSAQKKLHKR